MMHMVIYSPPSAQPPLSTSLVVFRDKSLFISKLPALLEHGLSGLAISDFNEAIIRYRFAEGKRWKSLTARTMPQFPCAPAYSSTLLWKIWYTALHVDLDHTPDFLRTRCLHVLAIIFQKFCVLPKNLVFVSSRTTPFSSDVSLAIARLLFSALTVIHKSPDVQIPSVMQVPIIAHIPAVKYGA